MMYKEGKLSDGSLEALKWFSLIVMTLDHVNKYVLHGSVPVFYEMGRLAMPIFGFVLSYNLARERRFEDGAYIRVIKRTLVIGIISSVPYVALGNVIWGWWPLNIMFTLCLGTLVIFLYEFGGKLRVFSIVVFLLLGPMVEFGLSAIGLIVTMWFYFRKREVRYLMAWFFCLVSLYLENGDFFALLAIPVVILAAKSSVKIPKLKLVFYIYYPLHLLVIFLIKPL